MGPDRVASFVFSPLPLFSTTMASLHITNLTGTPLSFTSSLLTQDLRTRWTRLDAGDKIQLPLSTSKLLGKWTKVGLQVCPTSTFIGEKSEALGNSSDASLWSLNIHRPRFGGESGSWYIVRPACQHTRGYRTRSRTRSCSTCTRSFPWNVYVLRVC